MTLPIFTRGQDKDLLKQILDKAKKPKTTAPTLKGGNSLINKIQNIQQLVQQRLGHYAEELQLIQTQEDLKTYIDKAIENGVIAIDTETTGLDPITDHIVGVCLYTPGLKSAYVPMYHISYITNLRLEKQLDNDVVGEQLQRVVDAKTHVIFFNAKFDIRMIRHSLGVYMEPFWDGFIAGKCLKEDEEEASLKYLWKKYCSDNKDAPHFTFDKMFKGLRFDLVPINTAYLYAAMDTKMTYELYKFQEPYLNVNDKKCQDLDMTRLAFVFHEIEMPIITVVCDIEDRGVHLNKGLAAELSKKYHELMDEQLSKFYEELSNYDDQINAYVATHPDTKIQTPLNIGSPAQLAELFYDILKVEPPDKRNPRGTGEDILKAMKHPLCELILQYRGTQKLLSTYIDKLPEELNPKTHKIHCGFHQYGAATGRFACIAEGTKISMPGGDKNIEDIQPGDWVYSYTDDGKLTLNKVKNKWFTGIRECVKLHWVSKYNKASQGDLICTPDHFIKTTDGWVMAKDLKPQHSIYHVHRKHHPRHVALSAHLGQGAEEEHAWIKQYFFNCWDKNIHIHHVDCNRHNNSPDNLMLVNPKVHVLLHKQNHVYTHTTASNLYNYTKQDLIDMCKSVNWELSKLDKHDFNTFKKWLQINKINYIQEYTSSYNDRPYKMTKHKYMIKDRHLPLDKDNIKYSLELSGGDVNIAAGYFGVTVATFMESVDKYKLLDNHNVISIEYLDGTRNVYDIEVENSHCYIANELCVHNSSNPNLQNIPSRGSGKKIRCMFISSRNAEIHPQDNVYDLLWGDVLDTPTGRKFIMDLNIGDIILNNKQSYKIVDIQFDGDLKYKITLQKGE